MAAITQEGKEFLVGLYMAMMQKAPSTLQLADLVAAVESGKSYHQIATDLSGEASFSAAYPGFLTGQEFADAVCDQLLADDIAASARAWAVSWVHSALQAGKTRATVILEAFQAMYSTPNMVYDTSKADLTASIYSALYTIEHPAGSGTDSTAPTLVSYSPAASTANIKTGADIVVTFSEAISLAGTIELRSGSYSSGTVIESFTAGSAGVSIGGAVLTLNPSATLAENQTYYLVIPSGAVKDLAGNSYAGNAPGTAYNSSTHTYETTGGYSFTTGDSTAPTLLGVTAAAGSGDTTVYSFSFSETLSPVSTANSAVTVTWQDGTDNPATATGSLSVSGSSVQISVENHAGSATPVATVAAGSIQDLFGNAYAHTSLVLSTAADVTAPKVDGTLVAQELGPLFGTHDLVVRFDEPVALLEDGTATLKRSTSAKTGSTIDSEQMSVDGNTLTIDASGLISNGKKYYLTLDNLVTDLAGNALAASTTLEFTMAAMEFNGTDSDNWLEDPAKGNSILNGLAGDDHLAGGKGADTLSGGDGADSFRYNAGDSTLKGCDVITDFDTAELDSLDLIATQAIADSTAAIDVAKAAKVSGPLTATVSNGVLSFSSASAAPAALKDALAAVYAAAEVTMADVDDTTAAVAFELNGSTYVADFTWTQKSKACKLLTVVELQDLVDVVGLSNTATGSGTVIFS